MDDRDHLPSILSKSHKNGIGDSPKTRRLKNELATLTNRSGMAIADRDSEIKNLKSLVATLQMQTERQKEALIQKERQLAELTRSDQVQVCHLFFLRACHRLSEHTHPCVIHLAMRGESKEEFSSYGFILLMEQSIFILMVDIKVSYPQALTLNYSMQNRALARSSHHAEAEICSLRNKLRNASESHKEALSAAVEAGERASRERNALAHALAHLSQKAV